MNDKQIYECTEREREREREKARKKGTKSNPIDN